MLSVTHKGYSISDLLDMTVQETVLLLENEPKISGTLRLLCDVGSVT